MHGSEAAPSLPGPQRALSLTQLRETQDGDGIVGDGQACGRTCPIHPSLEACKEDRVK